MLLSITEFIGHFHPLIVHLPIGILLIGLLLQWLSFKEKYNISTEVIKVVMLAGAVSAVFSCITGYMLSVSGEYDKTIINLHMWMGIAVAVVSILMYLQLNNYFYISYKLLSIGLLILVMLTGHLGGSLTHGSDYLTKPLGDVFGSNSIEVAKQKPIANMQEAILYTDIIQPILEQQCYSCHGKQKQKGKLRMDEQQYILQGGKTGAFIVAGKADESELIKRLLLPREDEHHMPPKEKAQLNEKQIALLHWWIQKGADFNKKVKQIEQPEKLKPILLALQSNQAKDEKKSTSLIPEAAVEKADEKVVQLLSKKGVVIIPVAQNSNYLSANFITATRFTNEDMGLLLPLKKQLVWLKLGHTNITDSGLIYIAQCSALTFLQLNNTGITDTGISLLKTLNNLQSLNIINTNVSIAGLNKITNLKKLQSLFLYQTKIDKKQWAELLKLFPKALLDSGGYSVPQFASDTSKIVFSVHKL